MSELDLQKRARDWSDGIPDDDTTERPDPYEETYRDGSAKHECAAEE